MVDDLIARSSQPISVGPHGGENQYKFLLMVAEMRAKPVILKHKNHIGLETLQRFYWKKLISVQQ
tara:strand:- start:362 stop:556 length:195 start_codon:yes stop_codon:yes gene_type:complete